ncbi:MAG: hypothetical protein ACK5NN_08725 [Sphingomonadaceae bacterium]
MDDLSHYYQIYGLAVASDFYLAEAESCEPCVPDITIRNRAVAAHDAGPNAANGSFRSFIQQPDGDLLVFSGVGRFRVQHGKAISVELDPGFDRRLIGLPLLGPVMAILLHQRGHMVLHASAIAIDDQAHVFLGDKGAGKSTTAAGLITAGHRLIVDDVVALALSDSGEPVIHAGFPAMKLDQDMIWRMKPQHCEVIEPDDRAYTNGKSRVRIRQGRMARPVPLGAVHRLSRGQSHAFVRADLASVLQCLIRYSYFPRLEGDAQSAANTAEIFSRASFWASRIVAGNLQVRDGLEHIGSLADYLTSVFGPAESLHGGYGGGYG